MDEGTATGDLFIHLFQQSIITELRTDLRCRVGYGWAGETKEMQRKQRQQQQHHGNGSG